MATQQLDSRSLVPLKREAHAGNEDVLVEEVEEQRVKQVARREERPIASRFTSLAKGAAYGAVQVVFVPWRFAMSDDYYNSFHLDPRTRSEQKEYRAKKNSSAQVTRRNTNYSVGCAAGDCKASVNINYMSYDPFDSSYLICSETCPRPIAAHKDCIRKSMASTGIGRYCHGCGECGKEIKMNGHFRLGFWEVPYTLMSIFRHCLRHYFIMPMIFCYLFYALLWAQAWIHYQKGIIDEQPTNPFKLSYIMYSATDPTWKWEAQSFRQKWFQGFVFYLLMLPLWWIILERVWTRIKSTFWLLVYRYDV